MSKNRRNNKGLSGKAHHKLMKRAHIAMAVHTQNAWIEDALGVATDNRPERHRLFMIAGEILARKRHGLA